MDPKLDVSYLKSEYDVKIDGRKLEPTELKSITSVTVTKGIGQADHFSFEVQDQLENGQFRLLGKKPFEFGKKVSIKLGYVGRLAHSIDAHIDTIAPSFSSGASPTFKVEGSHKGFALLKEKSEFKVYTEKKDSDIVKTIAKSVGLKATVDATAPKPDPKTEKDAGYSNWDFIRELAALHKEFEFFIDSGTLYFRKTKTGQNHILTFDWGESLLSFETTLDVSELASEVIVQNWKNKKKVEGKARAGSEKIKKLGKKFGSQIAASVYSNKKKRYIADLWVKDEEHAAELARANLEEASVKLITGNGTSFGIPELKPGVCIKLAGLGSWFSGKYYVEKTEHTIDGSGYQTTFTAWRNAL